MPRNRQSLKPARRAVTTVRNNSSVRENSTFAGERARYAFLNNSSRETPAQNHSARRIRMVLHLRKPLKNLLKPKTREDLPFFLFPRRLFSYFSLFALRVSFVTTSFPGNFAWCLGWGGKSNNNNNRSSFVKTTTLRCDEFSTIVLASLEFFPRALEDIFASGEE